MTEFDYPKNLFVKSKFILLVQGRHTVVGLWQDVTFRYRLVKLFVRNAARSGQILEELEVVPEFQGCFDTWNFHIFGFLDVCLQFISCEGVIGV